MGPVLGSVVFVKETGLYMAEYGWLGFSIMWFSCLWVGCVCG